MLFDFLLAAVLAGGLGPGRGPIRWRRVMGDGASCCVSVLDAGASRFRFENSVDALPAIPFGRFWLPHKTGADSRSCQPAIGHSPAAIGLALGYGVAIEPESNLGCGERQNLADSCQPAGARGS